MPAQAARKRKTRSKAAESPKLAKRAPRGKSVGHELTGLILIGVGLMLILATRLDGAVPTALLHGVQWLFGTYGAWGVSCAIILVGILLLVHLSDAELPSTSFGMIIIFLVMISLLQLERNPVWDSRHFIQSPGGFFGGLIAATFAKIMGDLAWLPLVFTGLCGLSLLTDMPLWMVIAYPVRMVNYWIVRPIVRSVREKRRQAIAAKVEALQEEELRNRKQLRSVFELDYGLGFDDEEIVPAAAQKAKPEPVKEKEKPAPVAPQPAPVVIPVVETEKPAPMPVVEEELEKKERGPRVTGVPSDKEPDQLQFANDMVSQPSNRPYVLPPASLLTQTPKSKQQSKDDTQEKIAALEDTLSSFGIDAKVVAVERGPRVTRFELKPPPGIRINRITNLADNIALSLAALDVRVEAPVPGKGVVGIEVPNKESVIVDFRDIVESEAFMKGKSPLTVALGRDIAGHPRVADLTKMPHMLIAGATNSGKSVCINCLICSILMRATPQQVKFLMVDPKRVELSLFQSIPHLIAPVAYDAKHAAGLLRWAIREMEQRYEMFAEKGVRNIVGFNETSRLDGLEELPYILIIIDELADLMMQAAAEFEASICRLAQLARATGIHLVVATQRPSVNVITGTIKANIPSRVAFAVASQVDSRTILDMNGAERLVGQGDMLFLPVDASKPSRIQGAYVSEKDINRIVEHVKTQGKPNFSDEIMAIEEEVIESENGGGSGSFGNEPEDELLEKALDYIRTTKYASTSMLQRKFRIGYTRAARMMDLFEERGYVGPGQGSKPREVIFAPASSVTGVAATSTGVDDPNIHEAFDDE